MKHLGIKKIISVILCGVLLLTACNGGKPQDVTDDIAERDENGNKKTPEPTEITQVEVFGDYKTTVKAVTNTSSYVHITTGVSTKIKDNYHSMSVSKEEYDFKNKYYTKELTLGNKVGAVRTDYNKKKSRVKSEDGKWSDNKEDIGTFSSDAMSLLIDLELVPNENTSIKFGEELLKLSETKQTDKAVGNLSGVKEVKCTYWIKGSKIVRVEKKFTGDFDNNIEEYRYTFDIDYGNKQIKNLFKEN